MRNPQYSNNELIRLLQRKAAEQYKLLEIRDEELMTGTIQKIIDLKTDDEFDIEFLRKIVKQIYLTRNQKVVYELNNKQYFDLDLC